jgi:hypothetical protein
MSPDSTDWDSGASLGVPDQAILTFGLPRFATDGSKLVSIPVRLVGQGLRVESQVELEAWGAWIPGLLQYLDGLDRDWRGWSGAREWKDDQDNVTLSAEHHSTLLATVMVVVKHLPERSDGSGAWTVRLAVPYEPAAMSRLAAWMRRQLERGDA